MCVCVCTTQLYIYIYIYAVYIMIQCTEPATPAVISCSELPVSLQEAVLVLKTPSPITALSERGEGFFRQLWVQSFPHFGKEQIKRSKQNSGRHRQMQADADGQADSQPCRRRRLKEREGVTNASFREVSHYRRDLIKFNSTIFTTELSKIQLNQVVPVDWIMFIASLRLTL